LSGIALARFYLDVHPSSRVVIIEKESEIGGTWSKCRYLLHHIRGSANQDLLAIARTFDTFWTQSPMRMTTFSDIPLTLAKDAAKRYDTFPAIYVSQYLEDYLENHVYADQPVG